MDYSNMRALVAFKKELVALDDTRTAVIPLVTFNSGKDDMKKLYSEALAINDRIYRKESTLEEESTKHYRVKFKVHKVTILDAEYSSNSAPVLTGREWDLINDRIKRYTVENSLLSTVTGRELYNWVEEY